MFLDIEPEHPDVLQQDYLDFKFENNLEKKVHIVGNPPFGRQSSLCIKFIKKSCSFCDSISFILPKSFKKDSIKRHFPLSFHLVLEWDLPPYSFLVEGKEHDVPCVFQIWVRKSTNRVIEGRSNPKNFKFVSLDEELLEPPDVSF